ncbi:MAG: hypothetical protein ABSC77_01285 [Terracidiphilus sp.]
MKTSKIVRASAICFCIVFISQFALSQARGTGTMEKATVRVGGWALFANGQLAKGFEYTGACPVNLKFDWGLIATSPVEVTYRYKRSDASEPSAMQKVNLPKANTSVSVYDTWQLGAHTPEFKNFQGWIKLTTFEPNKVEQKIDFTLHCK